MTDNTEHQEKKPAENSAAAEENISEASQQALADDLAALEEAFENADEQEALDGEEPSGFATPLEALAADLDKLEAENAGLKEQILRTHAEMENLRKRTQKEIADARTFSISGFARDMLSVNDNLRRALDAVSDEDKAHEGIKNLTEGVELTEREMLNSLEKNGVKKIIPMNEKFDPNFHQAMFEVPNPEVPNNTVIEVVQVGYVIGERVLRPAMVGIAKGGPKERAPKPAEADSAES